MLLQAGFALGGNGCKRGQSELGEWSRDGFQAKAYAQWGSTAAADHAVNMIWWGVQQAGGVRRPLWEARRASDA